MKIRQARALETKAKIIAAAEKLIAERGFDAVQIIDITNEAGVGKGSFYTYFKRKEDVVGEITHERFESIHESSAQLDGDVSARIASFLTGSMEYIKETGIKIAQQWVRSVADPEDKSGTDKLDYDRQVISGMLKKAIENGELAESTPVEKITEWTSTQYYGIVFCWALTDGESDPTQALEAFCSGILRDYLKQYTL